MTIEFDEITPESGSSGDRPDSRRLVAGVVAAMLVAAAGGIGYGIGRSVDRETATLASPDRMTAEPSSAGADEPPADAERDVGSAADTVPAAEMATDAAEASDDAAFTSSGGAGYPAFGTQPMDTLFERTTASGFTIRAQLGQTYDQAAAMEGDAWGPGDWRPAPWCFESGQLRLALSGNGVVDVGSAPWYAEPFRGRAVSYLQLGGNDRAPQWLVVVQAPGDVTSVQVTFGDGTVDEAAPQNGIAVLTGPAEPQTPVDEGGYTYWMDPAPNFEVAFVGGAEAVAIGSDQLGNWDDPEFRESCSPPPPALPDAGEQPTDPAAAEAEIRAAMTSLYGAIGDGEERSALVDDPTGIAEARQQVQDGGFAEAAASATATIEELVFTSPQEAWFRYRIDSSNGTFADRYGISVSVDGVWKITRATVCQDLSLAGGDCGSGWEPIFPPGAIDREPAVAPLVTTAIDD